MNNHAELRAALDPDIEPWSLPHMAAACGGQTIHLPSGRRVFSTGKVLIGLRAGERPDSARVFDFDRRVDLGVFAEKVQTGQLHTASRARRACTQDRCRQGRKACPVPSQCVVPLGTSLWARICRAVRWLRLRGTRL